MSIKQDGLKVKNKYMNNLFTPRVNTENTKKSQLTKQIGEKSTTILRCLELLSFVDGFYGGQMAAI